MAYIQLAEQDRSIRNFFSKPVGKSGQMVTSREEGVEAIAELEPRDCDLLLADIY